jgi:hypothetical protein
MPGDRTCWASKKVGVRISLIADVVLGNPQDMLLDPIAAYVNFESDRLERHERRAYDVCRNPCHERAAGVGWSHGQIRAVRSRSRLVVVVEQGASEATADHLRIELATKQVL